MPSNLTYLNNTVVNVKMALRSVNEVTSQYHHYHHQSNIVQAFRLAGRLPSLECNLAVNTSAVDFPPKVVLYE